MTFFVVPYMSVIQTIPLYFLLLNYMYIKLNLAESNFKSEIFKQRRKVIFNTWTFRWRNETFVVIALFCILLLLHVFCYCLLLILGAFGTLDFVILNLLQCISISPKKIQNKTKQRRKVLRWPAVWKQPHKTTAIEVGSNFFDLY